MCSCAPSGGWSTTAWTSTRSSSAAAGCTARSARWPARWGWTTGCGSPAPSTTGTTSSRCFDSATVFAMPSRTEGLPRALVEAMARGLPAVGTDVGGIPELLDARWIVPPDDDRALARVLAELLADPDTWRIQSGRNLDVARGYRTDVLREQFESWLSSLPDATSPRRRSSRAAR